MDCAVGPRSTGGSPNHAVLVSRRLDPRRSAHQRQRAGRRRPDGVGRYTMMPANGRVTTGTATRPLLLQHEPVPRPTAGAHARGAAHPPRRARQSTAGGLAGAVRGRLEPRADRRPHRVSSADNTAGAAGARRDGEAPRRARRVSRFGSSRWHETAAAMRARGDCYRAIGRELGQTPQAVRTALVRRASLPDTTSGC
jgi:hypothetical protein